MGDIGHSGIRTNANLDTMLYGLPHPFQHGVIHPPGIFLNRLTYLRQAQVQFGTGICRLQRWNQSSVAF
ncbi:hypothetical protein D3C75_1097020 [compost metagenome]